MCKTKFLLFSILLVSAILTTSGLFSGFGFPGPLPASAAEPSKLGPVQVPVILDGVRHEPQAYNRLKDNLIAQGIPLRYLLTPEARKQGHIYVFTSAGKEKEFLIKNGFQVVDLSTVGKPSKSSGGQVLPAVYTPVTIYAEHINLTGAHFWQNAGSGIADLRTKPCCNGGNWNDRISSLLAESGAYSYNWEHINYQGYLLTAMGYVDVPDLRIYGWNDLISSLWIYWFI